MCRKVKHLHTKKKTNWILRILGFGKKLTFHFFHFFHLFSFFQLFFNSCSILFNQKIKLLLTLLSTTCNWHWTRYMYLVQRWVNSWFLYYIYMWMKVENLQTKNQLNFENFKNFAIKKKITFSFFHFFFHFFIFLILFHAYGARIQKGGRG